MVALSAVARRVSEPYISDDQATGARPLQKRGCSGRPLPLGKPARRKQKAESTNEVSPPGNEAWRRPFSPAEALARRPHPCLTPPPRPSNPGMPAGIRGGRALRGWAEDAGLAPSPPDRVQRPPPVGGRSGSRVALVCTPRGVVLRPPTSGARARWTASPKLVAWAHANWAQVIVRVRRMQLQCAGGDRACMGANLRALRGPVVPMRMVHAVLGRAVLGRAAAAADLRQLIRRVLSSCTS